MANEKGKLSKLSNLGDELKSKIYDSVSESTQTLKKGTQSLTKQLAKPREQGASAAASPPADSRDRSVSVEAKRTQPQSQVIPDIGQVGEKLFAWLDLTTPRELPEPATPWPLAFCIIVAVAAAVYIASSWQRKRHGARTIKPWNKLIQGSRGRAPPRTNPVLLV